MFFFFFFLPFFAFFWSFSVSEDFFFISCLAFLYSGIDGESWNGKKTVWKLSFKIKIFIHLLINTADKMASLLKKSTLYIALKCYGHQSNFWINISSYYCVYLYLSVLPLAWSLSKVLTPLFHSSICSCSGLIRLSRKALWKQQDTQF